MLILILIALVLAVAAALGYATTRPDTFSVSRSARIDAPPERIYPFLSDLQAMTRWSPFELKDPGMKRSFSGAPTGVGAVYHFVGNSKVGAGRLEVLEVSAPSHVQIKLDMIKPLEGHNVIDFTLAPSSGSTTVTWSMQGKTCFPARLMSVFFDMDRMIGNDFEAGLATLKKLTETQT